MRLDRLAGAMRAVWTAVVHPSEGSVGRCLAGAAVRVLR
jgi:hypothetical protein